MSYRASIPNMGSISISNLKVYEETLTNVGAIRRKKDINFISLITYFRDRHFTIILWPQCSLGTSTVEHLSTASSCHTCDEAKNNIYTDGMATWSQRKWPYAHRRIKKNGGEKKLFENHFLIMAVLSDKGHLLYPQLNKYHKHWQTFQRADFHIWINVLGFMYTTQKWLEGLNHISH